jgi:DNA-binding transcriptional regulator YiaG
MTLDDSIEELIGDDPEKKARFDEAGRKIDVAAEIYRIRVEKLRMSKKRFGEILDVSAKEVDKIEYADFDESADEMLRRVRNKVKDWIECSNLPTSSDQQCTTMSCKTSA